jgi:hypothetical protein
MWKSLTIKTVSQVCSMSINDSVKDYKNKTIICKLIHDDYLISIKKNQDTMVCPRWISVAFNGSHYCRRW